MRVVDTSVWVERLVGGSLGAELLTCDAHFAKLPAVRYCSKAV